MDSRKIILVKVSLLLALPALGAVKYVDPNATGAGNGTSWANAYTSLAAVSASAGDTIYVSGGSSSQTYSTAGAWNPPAGSSGSPVTFTYSDEANHNGHINVVRSGGAGIFMQPTASGTFHDITWNFWDGTNYRCTISNFNQAFYVNGTTNFVRNKFIGNILNGRVEIIFAGYDYEIAFNYFDLPDNSDHAIALSGPPPAVGFGTNSIHNNTFRLRRTNSGNGFGDDGIQWGNSCDIYSNYFVGVGLGYTGVQHQDGIQTDGRYTRIFANTFQDFGNSCVYPDCTSGGTYQDFYIYNNIFRRDDAALNGSQRGIDAGPDTASAITIQNYRFWNNTFYGFTGIYAIGMYDHGHVNVTWTSCDAGNNVFVNCTDSLHHVPTVLTYYNVWGQDASVGTNNSGGGNTQTTVTFVNYPSDLHLTTNDMGAFEKGTNFVSGLFSTDNESVSRPQFTYWDAGAYEVSGSSPPPPPDPAVITRARIHP